MKKSIVTALSVVCASTLFSFSAMAQANAYAVPASLSTSSDRGSVKIENMPSAVNADVYNAFTAQFGNVKNVNWATDGNAISAYFIQNGNPAKAFYTAKGKLEYSIVYYTASNVPAYVSRKLKENGYVMNVISATEITRGVTSYVVRMSDESTRVTVQIQPDGKITPQESYTTTK